MQELAAHTTMNYAVWDKGCQTIVCPAGVGFFYVNLTLASWIKFNSVQTSAAIMTVVFCIGFVYFVYIHARWWGPVVKTRATGYGPNLKVTPFQ